MDPFEKHKLERALDAWSYHRNRHIMETRIFPSTMFRALLREVFAMPPEFLWNGRVLRLNPVFADLVKTFWIPFAMDFIMEIFCLGVVPVRLSKMSRRKGAPRIPVVIKQRLGVDYEITIKRDPETGLNQYLYRRLKDMHGDFLTKPIIDRKVTILFGYGFDPTPDGRLSCIASTLYEQEQYLWLNYRFSTTALNIMSRPPIFTRTTHSSEGVVTQEDMVDYYSPWDSSDRRQRDMFHLNDSEIATLKRHNDEMFSRYGEDADVDPNSIPMTKPHAKGNIFPLPADHVLERQINASHRGDFAQMVLTYQRMVASAIGIPPDISGEEVKVTAGAKLASHTLEKSVNWWKDVASSALSTVYCSLYQEEDCLTALSMYTEKQLQAMAPHKLQEIATSPRVVVLLRPVPADTIEDIVLKFGFGAVGWQEATQMMRTLSSQASGSVGQDGTAPPFDKDPWKQRQKIALVRAGGKESIAKLGALGDVVYEDPEQKEKREEAERKKREQGKGAAAASAGGEKRKRAQGGGETGGKKKARKEKAKA